MVSDSLIEQLEEKAMFNLHNDGLKIMLDDVITIIRQNETNLSKPVESGTFGESLNRILESIIGTLEPSSRQDWHGKWRIHNAIALVQKARVLLFQHQAEQPQKMTFDAAAYQKKVAEWVASPEGKAKLAQTAESIKQMRNAAAEAQKLTPEDFAKAYAIVGTQARNL